MKQLPLREVMRNLGITAIKDGYELSNPAGTARYDLHGVRTMVNGIPEYFPITLSVKGGHMPVFDDQDNIDAILGLNQSKTAESIGTMTLGINVDSASLTVLESQLTRIADLYERIQKARHQDKPVSNFYDDKGVLRLRIGKFGIKTANPPRTAFTVSDGQVFISDAQVSHLMKQVSKQAMKAAQKTIESELQTGGRLWTEVHGRR
ncbi:hypothetical protein FHU12_0452 [Serratia marcescens]|uniref:Uncharacterized protein n=1 Tax=Serratia marcescens TaxID=615 RepID=A0AA46Q7Q8_SERMA|nr:hypothetical protein [Serratia marcescens]TQI82990.1 hypothetical protein FHU12_0452 [Serratia marcescens]